jgi:hypothetical protein
MNIASLLTPRTLGAGLGLIASASVCIVIVVKLVEAAHPAPTAVRLINATPDPVVLAAASLSQQAVLSGPLKLPARPPSGPDSEWESKPVELGPGLPVAVKLTFAEPQREATCGLEPRPQGACIVRASYSGKGDLDCQYECKVKATNLQP